MHELNQAEIAFFTDREDALPLYQAFTDRLFAEFPRIGFRVQKTQITFTNRHVFACVSFARVKKQAELPRPYLVVTIGLPFALDEPRVAVQTEPYPGRWTHHIVITRESEVDDELFSWIREAYLFSDEK